AVFGDDPAVGIDNRAQYGFFAVANDTHRALRGVGHQAAEGATHLAAIAQVRRRWTRAILALSPGGGRYNQKNQSEDRADELGLPLHSFQVTRIRRSKTNHVVFIAGGRV